MPLQKGKSQKVVGKNVKELMHKYKKTGKIGTSKPASKKQAQKQAVAIALQTAGKAKTQKESSGFDDTINAILHRMLVSEMGIGYQMNPVPSAAEGEECNTKGPHDHNKDGKQDYKDIWAHKADKEDEEGTEEDCEWAVQGCDCDGCEQCRANQHSECGCDSHDEKPEHKSPVMVYVTGLQGMR